MSLRVRFSLEARDDLEAIKAYVGRDSPSAAADVIFRIRELIALLTEFPLLGKSSEIEEAVHKIPVRKSPYLIVYEVRPEELWIVRVYHSARGMGY